MNEFDLIARYFAPLATAPGAFGLKDDAAAIPPRPGFDLIVTTDQIAEGTDFFKHDPPDTDREEGAAGESVRSCRQRRGSRLLSAQPGIAPWR